MANRNFVKIIVLSLVWAIFLSLLITNWDALKSVRWQDLGETFKISGIGDLIKWNAGYFLLLSLFVLFTFLFFRNGRKHRLLKRKSFCDEWQKTAEYHDPAYSSQPGNIHYQSPFDKE